MTGITVPVMQYGGNMIAGLKLGPRRNATLAAAVSAALAAMPAARAQEDTAQQAAPQALESITVTAEKRVENLQEVPIAIDVLGNQQLQELHVESVDDYVKFLPGLTEVRSQGEGGNGQPGTTHLYMRGVVSGGDGNHSGSLPSVGVYLDEQPVTTIDGTIDVHMFDIDRVEVLEGPQGTLYGASSEAGTVRIITNKPNAKKFEAGYDVGVDTVKGGGIGHEAEGFINLPLGQQAAIRLVGWDEHDAGFISNVAGTNAPAGIINGTRCYAEWATQFGQTCPGAPIGQGSVNNAAYVKNNYNSVDTKGGRGALKIDLNDSWTITPTFMAQNTKTNGFFGYDPTVGDLEVTHFGPEGSTDTFAQMALTIEGKIQDFDIVYAGAYFRRDDHTVADYSDYSFFYDSPVGGSGAYFTDNAGKLIDPIQRIYGDDWYSKVSHELRMSTPKKYPLKATVGAFVENQVHEIYQRYTVLGYNGDGLANSLSVPGWADTIWLTDEERVDKDKAIFAQLSWDIDPHWNLKAGLRQFWADNSLQGFYGFNGNFASGEGTATCGPVGGTPSATYAPFHGAPCTDLDGEVKDSGHTPLLTMSYFDDSNDMLYVTYSKGFRPGGVNRARFQDTHQYVPPYGAEYLTNYEIGWKTQWLDNRLRWNGAIFHENWDNFQFSFLVPPSLTAIANAGQADINGIESEVEWVLRGGWSLQGSLTALDGKLKQDYCESGCATSAVEAPSGTRLPVAPHFKGDLIARYTFNMSDWKNHVQGALSFQSDSTPLLIVSEAQGIGTQPGFGSFDLAAGTEHGNMSIEAYITNLLDHRAELTRFAECNPNTCGSQVYIIPSQPRTIGIKFGQKF